MTSPKTFLASLAILLTGQGIAISHPPDIWRQDPPNVSVEFLVAGRPLPQHSTRGGAAFVTVPRWGVEYEIRITNHERHDRVLFVIGVDGLSVMDGRRASEHSGGYVLDPRGSSRIRGWRRGMDEVAAFTFTHTDDSYAARTERRNHIGEVWVWAVRERTASPIVKLRPEAAGDKAASRSAPYSQGETGTGYGDVLVDRVRTTDFTRSNSVRRLDFHYGLRSGPEIDYQRNGSGGDFTPPPPGWRSSRIR